MILIQKRIFNNNIEVADRQHLSYQFRENIQNFLNQNTKQLNIKDYDFGIDEKQDCIREYTRFKE
ncbi:hypothetical protein RCO48_09035 [Peribacillus frigoritolerans]|nr:hypothetical protein [Peribacillus frigoritolerans]